MQAVRRPLEKNRFFCLTPISRNQEFIEMINEFDNPYLAKQRNIAKCQILAYKFKLLSIQQPAVSFQQIVVGFLLIVYFLGFFLFFKS